MLFSATSSLLSLQLILTTPNGLGISGGAGTDQEDGWVEEAMADVGVRG
jgi:hypothetical protein